MKHYVLKATKECPDNLKDIIQCECCYMPNTYQSRREVFSSLAYRLLQTSESFWSVEDFENIHSQLEKKWFDFERYSALKTIGLITSDVDWLFIKNVKDCLLSLSKTKQVLVLWENKPEFRSWFDLHEIEIVPTGISHKINDKKVTMKIDIPLELNINMRSKLTNDVESVEVDFKDLKSNPPLVMIINGEADKDELIEDK